MVSIEENKLVDNGVEEEIRLVLSLIGGIMYESTIWPITGHQ